MKKLIASLCVAASFAAIADTVTSDTVFGVLKVESSSKETVISVPWLAAGTGDVKVKDLVKTSNLTGNSDPTKADTLLLYSGTGYTGWYLNENQVWTGYAVVTAGGITATKGDEETIARGKAIILTRQSVSDENIYLYGQYSGDAVSTEVTANGYTLVAPSKTSDFNLNGTDAMTGTPNKSDYIIVGLDTILQYRNTGTTDTPAWKWCKPTFSNDTNSYSYDVTNATIPAGKGFWYISTGAYSENQTPTFAW